MRNPTIIMPLTALLILCGAMSLWAGGKPEDSGEGIYVTDAGVAAGGADVVAYYSLAAGAPATRGSESFSYLWKGAIWLFSSQANRDAFAANPEAFAPQYGGYCAWAIARDKLAEIDPDKWTVLDGKLYLNYNDKIQTDWLGETVEYIEKADGYWPEWEAKLRDGKS